MFRWYQNASVCYVYLADVLWHDNPTQLAANIRESRWFTRGWTLQELIAPTNVELYSSHWSKIGTKKDHVTLLSSITNIDVDILLGKGDLSDIGIARKMSWASKRNTSRVEDMAYCLLGLFDVNIPLIYGEGKKAFQRLQRAIMESCSHDQSLLAWGKVVPVPSDLITEDQVKGVKPIPWKPPERRPPLLGLFAQSPADFIHSGDILPVSHGYMHHVTRKNPPAMVNGGVVLDLVIHRQYDSVMYWDNPSGVTQPERVEHAVLLCQLGTTGSSLVGLILYSWGDGFYSRTDELVPVEMHVSHARFDDMKRRTHVVPYRPFQLRDRDILIRRSITAFRELSVTRPVLPSGPAWRHRCGDRVFRLEEQAAGDEDVTILYEIRGAGHGVVAIRLKRLGLDEVGIRGPDMGYLTVGVSLGVAESARTPNWDGMKWGEYRPLHGRPFHESAFRHIMKTPIDTWELEMDGWPRIYVRVERMPLDGDPTKAVDILDFFMFPDGESAEMAKISVATPR